MSDVVRMFLPVLIIGAGLFSIVCSVKEYPFFWQHRRARMMVRILGLTGAKVFYVTLGVALVVLGAGIATGYLPTNTAVYDPAL